MTKSFILHLDSLVILEKMTNEQAGKFIKAVYFYQKNKQLSKLDFGLEMAITPFINQFKRDEKKYTNIVERNKTNGRKGGRPKKPKEPTGLFGNPKKPKKADSKNDSDSDSKNDSNNKNKKEEENYSQFSELYSIFSEYKNRKTPDKNSIEYKRTVKLLNDPALGFDYLKKTIVEYLEYLKVASWRIKKAYAPWMNDPACYDCDYSELMRKEEDSKKTEDEKGWDELENKWSENNDRN